MSQVYGVNTVMDGLVLYLDAANSKSYPGTGTSWSDLSGNNLNGTLVNGVGYSSNNYGTLTFDGTNDYVTTTTQLSTEADNLFADASGRFSVGVWFKWVENPTVYGTTNDAHVMVGRSGGIGSGATFAIFGAINSYNNGNGAVEFGKCFVACRGVNSKVSDTRIDNDNWYNVHVTWDGTTCLAYFNGEYSATLGVGTAAVQTAAGYELAIGNTRAGATGIDFLFNGSISQTSVYGRALSASEVLQNYNATKTRFGL